MITVTIEDVANSIATLNEVITWPLAGKTAYKVARLAREIDREYKLFEEERSKIQEKYWERNEDGTVKVDEQNRWHIEESKLDDYYKEINEVLKHEIELNAEKLDLEELINEKFTPRQMNDLMAFINE